MYAHTFRAPVHECVKSEPTLRGPVAVWSRITRCAYVIEPQGVSLLGSGRECIGQFNILSNGVSSYHMMSECKADFT